MKKNLLIFSILTACVLLISCGSKYGAISTADKFVKSYIVDYDINEFPKYYGRTEREIFQSRLRALEVQHKQQLMAIKNLKIDYRLDKDKTMIHQSEATIFYELTSDINPEFRQEVRVDLEKEKDGKWYVKYETLPRNL